MFKKFLVAGIFSVASLAAQADQVQLAYVGGAQTYATQVNTSGNTHWEGMGVYQFKFGDGSTFKGFCVDPFQWASSALQTYERSSLDATDFANNGSSRLGNVQKLFDNAYNATFNTLVEAGGFHLALWELFNDDGNLSTGSVKVDPTLGANGAVVAQANLLLSSLSNWATLNKFNITFYKNDCYQDYVSATQNPSAVPVPAALPLMASGLGLIGFARRRKTAA